MKGFKRFEGVREVTLKIVKKRALEIFSIPSAILFGVIVRVFLSFTSWIRAILLSVGVMDGFASSYLYKEEKLFPYHFLRYGRIVANMVGIVNPAVAIAWNIGDGIYSMILYRNASNLETIPRLGRVLNGVLLAAV
jgi:hypothetical protein